MSKVIATFTKTRAALAEFDAGAAAREEAWVKAESEFQVDRAWDADKKALGLVQHAFYEDTKAYNQLDNCLRIDISFIRTTLAKG